MPTLTQLEYIVTVEKLRHFGKAAEACHVSQPSLSMQIQKVEEELGIVIFDRTKKPILPTAKGQRFIDQAKVLLRENQRLIQISKQDSSEVSGDFHLGVIPTLAPYLLPLFIEDFSQNYPKVQLKIDEMKTDDIVRDLKEDALDAAILATPLHESGLKEKVLFYEEFFLYVGAEHSLSKRKRIREEELDGREMWLLQDGHCLRNQVVKICSIRGESGVFKNIRFEGGNLETLRYLVKNSNSYTLIPQLFANTLPEGEKKHLVKEFEQPTPSREISLVCRRDQWKGDILSALEKTLLRNLPKNLRLPNSSKVPGQIEVIGI
jgi:LysR family transcriptional regulator, hydrogen peroxide-inducible genes activator